MTNLPITSSAPQSTAPGKKPAATAESGDAQNSQPFGAVLARQISAPALKGAKADDQLAVELAAQTVTDTTEIKKDDNIIASETATTLPSDMLATLLPQVMAASVTTAAAASGGKTDSPAAVAVDRSGIATRKPDVAAGLQIATTAQTATRAAADTQTGEQSFAAALGELAGNRTSARQEPGMIAREAIAVAAAAASAAQQPNALAAAVTSATQQPNAAAMSTMQSMVAGIAAPAMLQAAQLTVNTPVNQQRWGDEFSQKITWLASAGVDQSAELHLNPPQLGPLDVVLKVSGDQATALFTSPHAAVREAIEQALPKLRDMLSDNGITLGNTTVSDQTPRDQSKPDAQRTPENANDNLRDAPATGANASRVSPISRHNGIVDTFA